ncbi:MAG: T9SS type A sorting domain-containing protein, partial [Saprospiraceae bacterium]|nr:T9SS type A sorting domain-containing protein [Saprospiraceae bacterium]
IIDTGLVFTCADLGTKVIKVYVGAEVAPGMIIWNFADVTVSIQDNGTPKACSNPTAMNTVRGQLITEVNANLKGAVIALDGNTSERLMTDDSGLFSFNQVAAGRDYMLKPVKDDDHANGINTLDLLHIQRHILGMSTLRSPYKLIAADVDKDSRVGVSDLVALRKLVLRSTDRFEKNTSWRFIDKNFQFKDPSEALNEVFSEQYEIINLTENMKIDFIAVKVGDVDGTAATNAKSSAKTTARSGQKLAFTVNNQNVSKGEIFDVTLSVEELSTVFGMQYQLNFDPNSAELIEAQSLVNGTTAQNYNLADAGRGNILSSWTAPYGQEMKDMVTFTFKAKRNLNTTSLLSFRDEWLTSEAYDENLEAIQLEMRNGGKVIEGFNLYQNNPNPFNDLTSVSFDLPESMNARFTIFDVTGKVIKQINRKFEGGKNTIQIESSELENAGVYFYSLEAGGFNATKKMVILE